MIKGKAIKTSFVGPLKSNDKKISEYIYENNRRKYFLAVLFSVISYTLSVGVALILQQYIDKGIGGGFQELYRLIFISVVFIGINILVNLIETIVVNRFAKKALQNLKRIIVEKILTLRLKDFNKEKTGTYISILNNDLTIIEQDYIRGGITLISQTIMIVVGILLMFYINWKLAICVLASCVLPLIVSAIFNKKLEIAQNNVSLNNSKYTSFIKDILTGYSVIKSFNIEKEVLNLSESKVNVQERSKEKYQILLGLVRALTQNSTIIIVIVLFVVGAWLTIKGQMTIGGILAFVQLLNNVTSPINEVISGLAKKKASVQLLEKSDKLLRKEIEKGIKVHKINIEENIRIENMSFAFDPSGENVLENINLVFEKGKSYAIVGLSGSGKSTLLKLLAGYYDWFEGNIYIDDIEIRDIHERSLTQLYSIVQQDTFVFDDTIEENIKLYREWPEAQVNFAISNAGMNSFLEERGGLQVLCGEGGMELSGGEKQRISIARALLKEPPILLMDEATSALDLKTTRELESSLSDLKDMTRIVITHKVDEQLLKDYDCIIMMKDGRVSEMGNINELLQRKGEFYSLCQLSDELSEV
ncbi:ABC transporter ATP-binding protein [Clostridium sp. D2Q-14]|uniref:ABC transporter ATP-binding protein n=1 Tax=Anaeromonas gelatinilytica TaxID=2683194 RepID=UPI00193B1A96|nr:ABC transporter ATP-binding protein [Anaeromonas gelatinilytica]MBS4535094.1 ABC transporter ATP-binding protein [Anaeromonas gelatinilytica]